MRASEIISPKLNFSRMKGEPGHYLLSMDYSDPQKLADDALDSLRAATRTFERQRRELEKLRRENENLKQTVDELRDENLELFFQTLVIEAEK